MAARHAGVATSTMATTAAAAEDDDAKKQAHDDAAVGSISHILRTLFRGLYEESEAP